MDYRLALFEAWVIVIRSCFRPIVVVVSATQNAIGTKIEHSGAPFFALHNLGKLLYRKRLPNPSRQSVDALSLSGKYRPARLRNRMRLRELLGQESFRRSCRPRFDSCGD